MEERREAPRKVLNVECVLLIEGRRVPASLIDLSETGAFLRVGRTAPQTVSADDLGLEATFTLKVFTPARRYKGEIIRRLVRGGSPHIALRFWEPYVELP